MPAAIILRQKILGKWQNKVDKEITSVWEVRVGKCFLKDALGI